MSVSNELMELLTAALGKSAAPAKKPKAKKAAPALDEINGIELHDDSEPAPAPKPKKKVVVREVEAPPLKKARAPKVSGSAGAEQVGGAPPAAPKAKRMPVKAMPHSCSCPMCPLKE